MRTFQENDCLGNIPNAEMYAALIDYAKSNGVPVYYDTSKEGYTDWPNIIFNDKELCGNHTEYGSAIRNWITFEQFFECCNNWRKCQPAKVKLNDEYTAEILDGKVKVGCQYFTFEAIEELYKATKK